MVSDDQLALVLQSNASLHDKVQQLVKMANAAGGPDNITALLAAPDEENDQ